MAVVDSDELATFLGRVLNEERADLLLDLAQGLVTSVIGEQDVWPPVARTIILNAAARAYVNPTGASAVTETAGPFTRTESRDAGALGVFLTDDEMGRLQGWLGGGISGPQGAFPPARGWPDPVERWCSR